MANADDVDRLPGAALSRRALLKTVGLVSAAASAMGLVACSSPAPAAAPTTAAAPAAAATTAPAAAATTAPAGAATTTPAAAAAAKPAAAATTAPATTGKQRFLVWATHVFYNQPALLGIPVGFHDFLDPLGWKFQITAARTSTDV